MFKFIRGLIIWQVMKMNMTVVKKILIALFVLLISLYFFPDWEDYFSKKDNLDMLLYTKLTKYLFLVASGISLILNAKKLSLLGRKEKKRKDKKEDLETQQLESYDPDIEEIRTKKELRSKSDRIKEKYK